jgi:hypothetical protein
MLPPQRRVAGSQNHIDRQSRVADLEHRRFPGDHRSLSGSAPCHCQVGGVMLDRCAVPQRKPAWSRERRQQAENGDGDQQFPERSASH